MARLYLRVSAPFAAFRWMQAGVYRATSPIMPPSVAWGFLLNLANYDFRGPLTGTNTLVRGDAPPLRIAVAREGEAEPELASLYQQLHTYPVGNAGDAFRERTHGAKYWIAPARREVLVGLHMLLAVEAKDPRLLQNIEDGLAGRLDKPRFGLPFLGDNNFLPDRIDVLREPVSVYWFERLLPGESPRRGSCRLTVSIDRTDSSRTRSEVYAPVGFPCEEPPPGAWTWTPQDPG